jgi:hypothetical protein
MSDPIQIAQLEVRLTQHGSLRCFGTGHVRDYSSWWSPKFEWEMGSDGVIIIRFDAKSKNAPLDRIQEVEQELRKLLTQMSGRLVS